MKVLNDQKKQARSHQALQFPQKQNHEASFADALATLSFAKDLEETGSSAQVKVAHKATSKPCRTCDMGLGSRLRAVERTSQVRISAT